MKHTYDVRIYTLVGEELIEESVALFADYAETLSHKGKCSVVVNTENQEILWACNW